MYGDITNPAQTIIELVEASADRRDGYGVTHVSAHVYRMAGAGLHNRHFPHRVTVWDNTGRPNTDPDRWTDYGGRTGPGAYVDPHGKGTDQAVTVSLGAESVAITSSGTNTGTPGSGQLYADASLRIGEAVRLRYPDGTVSDPYTVTARRAADPVLVPAA